jgi:hypothetical protein
MQGERVADAVQDGSQQEEGLLLDLEGHPGDRVAEVDEDGDRPLGLAALLGPEDPLGPEPAGQPSAADATAASRSSSGPSGSRRLQPLATR